SHLGTDMSGADIVGYDVEAVDGSIGKIDDATYELGASYVVVDTGPWIFGKKVMLPAGVVSKVDQTDETVYVARTKDEIKHAPEFDDDALTSDAAFRMRVGSYYGGNGEDRSRPNGHRAEGRAGGGATAPPAPEPHRTHSQRAARAAPRRRPASRWPAPSSASRSRASSRSARSPSRSIFRCSPARSTAEGW